MKTSIIVHLDGRREDHDLEECKEVCNHCPFRKDKKVWTNSKNILLNIFRISEGSPQGCHMSKNQKICKGSLISLQGGNDIIFSLEELKVLEPCPESEAKERYYSDGL